jgi:4-hydroxymandelate oxidase
VSLAEADAAWRRRRLRPRVLVDVSAVDLSTTMAGQIVSLPLGIAPMAAHGLAHPDAEIATARAAAAAGVPFTVSTMSSASLEAIAAAAPDAPRWFQLYVQADPRRSRQLVERAEAAGYRAILVTVDLPVLGYRERDLRNGWSLSVPLGNFAEPIDRRADGERSMLEGDRSELDGYRALDEDIDLGFVWADLATIRSWTRLPIFLKGILAAEDARLAVDAGVRGIVVSNHGARQLDRAVAPADALEAIVAAVGDELEVWVDGGVRRGLDVVTAVALGARGVLIGRPVLWALAAGGEMGVARALEILRTELVVAMKLLGAPTVANLRRSHVVVGPASSPD